MLSEPVKITIKDAAKKLTGYRKRDFMAKVSEDYFDGSARKAETVFGCDRPPLHLGLELPCIHISVLQLSFSASWLEMLGSSSAASS